jgi:hypothetical protein
MVDHDGIIECKEDRIIRLEKLLADFKRALHGAKFEKANLDQYHLALEDIETAMAVVAAATGGSILDLVRELCSCDIRDALQHLEKTARDPRSALGSEHLCGDLARRCAPV